MAAIDDFMALPHFEKPVPGWGFSTAVTRNVSLHPAIKKHAEITGSMNLPHNHPGDVIDTLLGLAEECNGGEGASLCLNLSPYHRVPSHDQGLVENVLEFNATGDPREIDAQAWTQDEFDEIASMATWAENLATKIAATSRAIDDQGGTAPLAVEWVFLDCEVFWTHRRDGTERTPTEQEAYLDAVRVKLDIASTIIRRHFPGATLGWYRNGEPAFFPGGGNMIAAYLADCDCRMVEWYSPHSWGRTLKRMERSKQVASKARAKGGDNWGIAFSCGGGYAADGSGWTFDYQDARKNLHHVGRHFASDDGIRWAFEYPGPFDQRIGTQKYAAAMVEFAEGFAAGG